MILHILSKIQEKQNGFVGGYMVKKTIEHQEKTHPSDALFGYASLHENWTINIQF